MTSALGSLDGVRFDHVGLVVRDVRAAAHLFIDVLGGEFLLGGDNHLTHNRVVQIALGGSKVELLQPLDEESALTAYLARRGEGFHHITLRVDDLERAVDQCREADVAPVEIDHSNPVWQEAFLSPRATGGTLLQLASSDRSWSEPLDGISLEQVLAGSIEFRDAWPVRRSSHAGTDVRPDKEK